MTLYSEKALKTSKIKFDKEFNFVILKHNNFKKFSNFNFYQSENKTVFGNECVNPCVLNRNKKIEGM